MKKWLRRLERRFRRERWYDRQEAMVSRRYEAERANLPKDATADDREELRHRLHTDLGDLYAEREAEYTRDLRREARRLRVPIPRGDDYWGTGPFGEPRYLTSEGIQVLRDGIREEERWRMERRKHWASMRKHWASIVTALAGLVGALTGLLAVIFTLR